MNLPRFRFVAFAFLALFLVVPPGSGQSTKMPSTLRYGSGILDIPVGSVMPHKTFTATYSGFGISIDQTLLLRENGEVRRRGFGYQKWLSDMSLALGLFDRVEVGATIQHIDDETNGGNILGGFGRISLLPSSVENLNLAVGARYLSSPSFGARWVDDLQPARFGHPDYRTRMAQGQGDEFNSNLSPYVVGTAILPTSDASFISLTLGWGAGLFSAGGDLDFYAQRSSGGIFAGSTVHIGMGRRARPEPDGRVQRLRPQRRAADGLRRDSRRGVLAFPRRRRSHDLPHEEAGRSRLPGRVPRADGTLW